MTLRRLDNASWGFSSDCFVCEATNAGGLHLAFFHDDEAATVYADFALGPAFSGPPHYVHGGISLAVLDEAMAWAAIALAHSFALTRTSRATFLRPVEVDRPHRVEARLVGRPDEAVLALAAILRDGSGRSCVEAAASFAVMSPAQAASAIGPLQADHAGYVRP